MPLLHWAHHALTFIICYRWWRETQGVDGLNLSLAMANLFVHFWMYGYYAAKSKGVQFPSWVPKAITTMQLVQMTYLIIGINVGYFHVQAISQLIWCVHADGAASKTDG